MQKLKFRSVCIEDVKWMTEVANDPEAAKYLVSIYPCTEHEIREHVKREIEEAKGKQIITELNGDSAGWVGIWPRDGRIRHIAWLGIYVRRKYWGRGVGTALMKEAIRVAKELGCKRMLLGMFAGNERALKLYKKLGFEIEGHTTKRRTLTDVGTRHIQWA